MVKRMLTFGNAMLTGVNAQKAASPGRRTPVRVIRRGPDVQALASTKDRKGTKSVGHGEPVADAPCPPLRGPAGERPGRPQGRALRLTGL